MNARALSKLEKFQDTEFTKLKIQFTVQSLMSINADIDLYLDGKLLSVDRLRTALKANLISFEIATKLLL